MLTFNRILFVFLTIFFFFANNTSFALNHKHHDGEIVAFMEVLNNHEIDVSKMVKNKNTNQSVLNYADMMIDQHNQNLKEIKDVSSENNISADKTTTVEKFREKTDHDLKELSKLDGNAFQKSYIHAMIVGHSEALRNVKNFEKQAQNSALKEYLVSTNKAIQKHLIEAKKLK